MGKLRTIDSGSLWGFPASPSQAPSGPFPPSHVAWAGFPHTAGLWVLLGPSASPDIPESLEGGVRAVKGSCFACSLLCLGRIHSGCNSENLVLCRWVQEFLNEENRGLDVLLEYLAFAQCSVA